MNDPDLAKELYIRTTIKRISPGRVAKSHFGQADRIFAVTAGGPLPDALRGRTGALIIGDAEKVAEKVLYVNEVLGGLSRITFQMGVSALPHQKMLRSIELLGTRVGPIVRKQLTTVLSNGVV